MVVAHLTPKQLRAQVHVVEGVDSLVIVRLDLGLLDILEPLVGSHDCGLGRVRCLEFQAQLETQDDRERVVVGFEVNRRGLLLRAIKSAATKRNIGNLWT